MSAFTNLEDSPMFQKQIFGVEEGVNELRDRCQKLYKGCNKFMASLEESCNAENIFADCLEAFGGGHDDPVSVSVGGPIFSKFVSCFRELATYKEFLRSQVEHVLIDKLMHFMDVDLHDVKESRRQLEKATHVYDQSRDRFVSLKKNTREDIVEDLEEDLKNAKSMFERSRFNLVSALMAVEAKRKYEFLDSVSAVMDAHLRYFKLGYELFSQMEPYINQVLAVAQHSKEQAHVEQDKLAKRIQEFRTQAEMDSLIPSSRSEPLKLDNNSKLIGLSPLTNDGMFVPSSTNGEVQIIKQGYLLKRSSNLRGDWKRRFFILNNQGSLYYYRNKSSKSMEKNSAIAESGGGVFSRFRSKPSKSLPHKRNDLNCQVLDLRTSKLKDDADDLDLRLCFRIITPGKTYTLQTENSADRMDWVNKITSAIASLLNSHLFNLDHKGTRGATIEESPNTDFSHDFVDSKDSNGALKAMREIPGNDLCAECSTPNPEWASLNLGILFCIQCSGAHRNLGVHISKVRSLTLDVKVWEPTILELFRALGNAYCNSVWEGMLLITNERVAESKVTVPSITKPCPSDSFNDKEKYIYAKYAEKKLILKDTTLSPEGDVASLWEAVKQCNIREMYRILVQADTMLVNSTCPTPNDDHIEGFSLLHLACQLGNIATVEMLLLFGADVNHCDVNGRTSLHHCIIRRDYSLAKFLLKRGASAKIKDGGGLSVLERAMEMGAITDDDLFIMLTEG